MVSLASKKKGQDPVLGDRFPHCRCGYGNKLFGGKSPRKISKFSEYHDESFNGFLFELVILEFPFPVADLLILAGKNDIGIVRVESDHEQTHGTRTDIDEGNDSPVLPDHFSSYRITGLLWNTLVKKSPLMRACSFSAARSPMPLISMKTLSATRVQ